MNMLLQQGIIDNRKNDEAKIIIEVTDKLRNMAMINGIVQRDLIRSYIEIVQNQYNPMSIPSKDEIAGTIYGILTLLKNIHQINTRIEKLQKTIKKLRDQGADKKDITHYKTQLKIWKESKTDLAGKYEENLRRHENIIDTIKQFEELDETTIKKGEKEIKGGQLR